MVKLDRVIFLLILISYCASLRLNADIRHIYNASEQCIKALDSHLFPKYGRLQSIKYELWETHQMNFSESCKNIKVQAGQQLQTAFKVFAACSFQQGSSKTFQSSVMITMPKQCTSNNILKSYEKNVKMIQPGFLCEMELDKIVYVINGQFITEQDKMRVSDAQNLNFACNRITISEGDEDQVLVKASCKGTNFKYTYDLYPRPQECFKSWQDNRLQEYQQEQLE